MKNVLRLDLDSSSSVKSAENLDKKLFGKEKK